MQKNEISSNLSDREAAYRLLSACYYQPCAQWDEAQLFSLLCTLLQSAAPQASDAAGRMAAAWSACDPEELAVDHARLFVGPMALQAPPYGSLYLESEKRVMGASTVEVLRFYREVGLEIDQESGELPDHIALELECVSYLLQRAVASESEADFELWLGRGRYFIDTFLAPWCGLFCAELRSNADNPFYVALGDCTELLVARGLEGPSA